jgi:hypothetical protein
VVSVEPAEDPGRDQEVVHQGVDGDHAGADLDPDRHIAGSGEQDAGQGHGQDLVGDTIGLSQRSNQGFPQPGEPIWMCGIISSTESLVDPSDQVAVTDIPDEQKQGIGHLVEAAVPQVVGWQRAGSNMVGLGAGPADLVEPAAMEVPVALELGAGGTSAQLSSDIGPGHVPMRLHVGFGDLIRDALVAQRSDQPIEQCWRVATSNRGGDPGPTSFMADPVDEVGRTSETADPID